MSLNRQFPGGIPRSLKGWAKKNQKNPVVALVERAGNLFDSTDFEKLYHAEGQPGVPPWRLAIVTILQHAHGLSDREAVDYACNRLDWKYALRMEIDEPVFDHTVLAEFRERLVKCNMQDLLLNKLIELAAELKILNLSKQRTDATHIVSSVRTLGRLERIREAIQAAIDSVLTHFPEIFISFQRHDWIERYDRAPYHFKAPKDQKRREQLATQMGEDASELLNLIRNACTDEPALLKLEKVSALQAIFEQQYILKNSTYCLRDDEESVASAERIASPHDTEARFGRKGSLGWLGYKTHLTETCMEGFPRLITNALTTHAAVDDTKALPEIHKSVKNRGFGMNKHYLDAGYTDVDDMLNDEELLGIEVVGPTKPSSNWQVKDGKGFDITKFQIDFDNKRAICPRGIVSTVWSPRPKGKSIQIRFPKQECQQCPFRDDCTKSANGRKLEVKNADAFRRLQKNRLLMEDPQFKADYKRRSGIEGTISQAVRNSDIRRTPYVGLKKTALQAWLAAAGINLYRIAYWILETPLAKTRPTLVQKYASLAA